MKNSILNSLVRKWAGVFCCLLLAWGCDHDSLLVYDENSDYRAAADYIQNNYDLSLFYAALERAGMVDELNSTDTRMTIFVPDNQAFNRIGIYVPSDFDQMDKDSLKQMIEYSILKEPILMTEIPKGTFKNNYVTELNGYELSLSCPAEYSSASWSKNVRPDDGADYFYAINGSWVKYADIKLKNGFLNVINRVLNFHEETVQNFLAAHDEYQYFVAALKQFGRWDQLADPNAEFTVFAPTNQCFENATISLDSILRMNPESYHDYFMGCYLLHAPIFLSYLDVLYGIGSAGMPGEVTSAENVYAPIDEEGLKAGCVFYFGSQYVDGQNRYGFLMGYTYKESADSYARGFNVWVADYDGLETDIRCTNGIVHNLNEELLFAPNDTIPSYQTNNND